MTDTPSPPAARPDARLLRPAAGPVDRALAIPGSKSVTNRALLMAALAGGTSTLTQLLASDDTEAMVGALRSLGFDLSVDWTARTARIGGSGGHVPATGAEVLCREAGTVARFLLAATAAAGRGRFQFDARPSLRRRPVGPLVETLEQMGAAFEPAGATTLPLTLVARGLRGGEYEVGGASSQFVSGLLMAAPMCAGPVELVWNDPVSRPYLDLTCSMMAGFGVDVERPRDGRFRVNAPAVYRAADLMIEADASTASYFFAAAAVTGGRVTVTNLSPENCHQGDIEFLKVLGRLGCQVEHDQSCTTVTGPDRPRAISVDMSDTPDVFMTLACLAPYADGPVEISGVGQTRTHESDRIAAVTANLRGLGVAVEERPDGLLIHPGQPHWGVVDSFGDHRVAMSFAVLALRAPGVEIQGARCVDKTCPEFFDLWDLLLD